MKVKLFCRVGKGRHGVKGDANTRRPNAAPLTEMVASVEKWIPTVNVTVELELPDSAFDLAHGCLVKAQIPQEAISVAAEVRALA